jgi:hypothetical protein
MNPYGKYGYDGRNFGNNAALVPTASLPAPYVPQLSSPDYVAAISQGNQAAAAANNAALAAQAQRIRNAAMVQKYAAQAARQITSEQGKQAFLDGLDSQNISYDPAFRSMPWQAVQAQAADLAGGGQAYRSAQAGQTGQTGQVGAAQGVNMALAGATGAQSPDPVSAQGVNMARVSPRDLSGQTLPDAGAGGAAGQTGGQGVNMALVNPRNWKDSSGQMYPDAGTIGAVQPAGQGVNMALVNPRDWGSQTLPGAGAGGAAGQSAGQNVNMALVDPRDFSSAQTPDSEAAPGQAQAGGQTGVAGASGAGQGMPVLQTGGQNPPQGQSQAQGQGQGQSNAANLMRQAVAAVAGGADKAAVRQRLITMGLSDEDLASAGL